MIEDNKSKNQEPQKPVKSEFTLFQGTVVFVIFYLGFSYVLWPMVKFGSSEALHTAGFGWNRHRDVLIQEMLAEYKASGFQIFSEKLRKELAECHVSSVIEMLNSSGCRSHKLPLVSKRDAEKEQELCASKLGLEEKSANIAIACTKKIIPNSWSALREVYAENIYTNNLDEFDPRYSESARRGWAECMAKVHLSALEATNCLPMNFQAASYEGFWNLETCEARLRKKGTFDNKKESINCMKQAH